MADYAKGDVLIELRKKTGLSREKAAAEIGVTTKTLFTWEMENGGIRLQNAQKLADFYGVDDPSTLLTRSEEGGDQLDRIETMLSAIVAHLGIEMPTPRPWPNDTEDVKAEAMRLAEEKAQRARGRKK